MAFLKGMAALITAFTLFAGSTAGAPTGYDWLQFDGNPQHSGDNTLETQISAANAATLHLLYRVKLPGAADGAPAFLRAVSTAQGVKDLVFLTTQTGSLLALDAADGSLVWSRSYGPGGCTINLGSSPCYTTSSPAIDPDHQYVYTYGLDGRVHKLHVGDGSEVTGGGWPEIVTLKGFDEKGSSALSFATARNGVSYLYVASAGYPGDRGDYQGHITAIDLASGAQQVFNTLCSDQTVHFVSDRPTYPGTPDCPQVMGAVWARPGVVYDPETDRIYLATGNGLYDGNAGGYNWGDSVLALNPDGSGASGKPLDSYTPTNFQQLDANDTDLGSTAPAIVPAPPGSSIQRLGVQGGKDAVLRLLNLEDLSGQGGPGHTGGEVFTLKLPQGGGILTQPAVWVNPADQSAWVFVANSNGISAFKVVLAAGAPALAAQWTKPEGGASPIVANGVIYSAGGSTIYARDAVSGALLWSAALGGGIHWASPIVANGVLYVPDQGGHLSAYVPTPLNDHLYLPCVDR